MRVRCACDARAMRVRCAPRILSSIDDAPFLWLRRNSAVRMASLCAWCCIAAAVSPAPDAPDLLVMASVRVWGVHPLLCALFLARRHV